MPSQLDSHQYGQAILDHVQSGAYPESEEVISAELPSSALPEVCRVIEQAKKDVKFNIRKASKDSAPDIDGWISQAKQLRVDIQKSQEIAQAIVAEARQGEYLEEQFDDASSKLGLLEGEMSFNKGLGATLLRLQAIQRSLDLVQRATIDDQLLQAVDLIKKIDGDIASLSMIGSSARISGVLGARVRDLREHVVEKLKKCWSSHISVNQDAVSLTFGQQDKRSSSMPLDSLVTALDQIGLFHEVVQTLGKDMNAILLPRLQIRPDATISPLKVDGDELRVIGQSSDLSAQTLFMDLKSFVSFLNERLPTSIVEPLANIVLPDLISRLIVTWLASAVPESLDEMEDFEDTISLANSFSDFLDTRKLPGKHELVTWTRSIPNVWLKKCQETQLNRVRKFPLQGLGTSETVERVETQVISKNDEVFAAGGGGDDWDAGWSEDESSPTDIHTKLRQDIRGEDEEDVSAWGLDEDTDGTDAQSKQGRLEAADDDTEAWGWGDENDGEETTKALRPTDHSPKTNMHKARPDSTQPIEREVTLKETYTISSLPKELLDIIRQVLSDAARLETSDYASLPVASAAHNLLSLPGLVLAMYRATSTTTYSQHPSGSMYLYNDSIWLAERLQHLHPQTVTASGKRIQSRNAHNFHLPEHISALEGFGKRAYAKEMETQRTIITDLLDGAQGFVNCIEHPFNSEADLAVTSTIDHLRQLHKQWKDVLSHSALLQSLGSLLSSVTNKMIADVEDMSDISEPESQQLTAYCNRIAALEDLFLPMQESQNSSQTGQQDGLSLVVIYTPHWLKFQYLANILESSLIDIKYLWTEGELGLEFDTEELVDLVVALFADSPRRREAVGEIRRRRGVR